MRGHRNKRKSNLPVELLPPHRGNARSGFPVARLQNKGSTRGGNSKHHTGASAAPQIPSSSPNDLRERNKPSISSIAHPRFSPKLPAELQKHLKTQPHSACGTEQRYSSSSGYARLSFLQGYGYTKLSVTEPVPPLFTQSPSHDKRQLHDFGARPAFVI